MKTVQIELPDEVLISLKETPASFSREVCVAAAAKLYDLDKLSSGRAAELAGMPRASILQVLGRYGVPGFDMSGDRLGRDIEDA